MQLNHQQNRFSRKTFPITIICDQVISPANVGSVFRAADAFGAEKIIFCGNIIPEFGRRMQKTSRSTEKYVPFEITTDIMPVIQNLKDAGYQICALEITDTSIPLREASQQLKDKVALIIGGENLGIEDSVLSTADCVTHIVMYGNNSSMNVAQALSLALYEFTNHCIAPDLT